MKTILLIIFFSFLIQQEVSAEECLSNQNDSTPIILLSDELMTITKTLAATEKISSKEDEVIKISVQKIIPIRNKLNFQTLSKDKKLLSLGIDKKTKLTQLSEREFSAERNIFGFVITFDSEIDVPSHNTLHLKNSNYSHVFIKSDTYLIQRESNIEINSTIYLKKSSLQKLQKLTLGNALTFIQTKVQGQVKDVSGYILERAN